MNIIFSLLIFVKSQMGSFAGKWAGKRREREGLGKGVEGVARAPGFGWLGRDGFTGMRGGAPDRGPRGSGSRARALFPPGLPRAGPVGPRSWAATVFDPGGRHTSIPRGDPTGASGPGRGSFFCLPAAALGPGRVRFLLSSSSGAEPWVLSFVFQLWRWAPGGGRGDFLFRPEFTSGRGQRPREGRQSFYSVDFFPLIFFH